MQPSVPCSPPSIGAFFGWGQKGAIHLASTAACVVVVDVLSFTTAVAVATSRGIAIMPCPDDETALRLASAHRAELAVNRRDTDIGHPWSLSPASLATAPPTGLLVLASPNGSAVSAIAAGAGVPVVAGCLRNASAAASWLVGAGFATPGKPVAVIAAGERWPDGALRPAVEDLLGAALVLARLADAGVALSPEAELVANAVSGSTPGEIASVVRRGMSGIELVGAGFEADVQLAVEIDSDDGVPVMLPGEQPQAYRHLRARE